MTAATSGAGERAGAAGWAHSTGRLSALGFDFAVRTDDAQLGRYLEELFLPFRSPGTPAHLYSILGRPGRYGPEHVVSFDGTDVLASRHLAPVFRAFLTHVNRRVVEETADHLLLHAAAAEDRGTAVLLPAPTESGKTTLVAGLVRAGLRYLTDDVVGIDPASLLVTPYPKALAIDAGSWEVLAGLRPPAPPFGEGIQWHVPPLSIRSDAVAPPARPRLVITPRYDAGAETRLLPLRRAEAVKMLIDNSFNFRSFPGGAGLRTLAAVVRGCTCHQLVVGDLDEACALVLRLLACVGEERVELSS